MLGTHDGGRSAIKHLNSSLDGMTSIHDIQSRRQEHRSSCASLFAGSLEHLASATVTSSNAVQLDLRRLATLDRQLSAQLQDVGCHLSQVDTRHRIFTSDAEGQFDVYVVND